MIMGIFGFPHVKKALYSAAMVAIASCGAIPYDEGTISSLDISDPGLALCVELTAAHNGWLRVEDVTHLHCSNTGKTRVANYEDTLNGQFPDHLKPADKIEGIGILDASDVNKLRELRQLTLDGNYFKKIDLTGLTNLQELSIASALVEELDLSDQVMLEKLDVNSTFIKELDLTNLINLRSIDISGTAIKKIDLTGLKLIYSFVAERLEFGSDDYQLILIGEHQPHGLTATPETGLLEQVIYDKDKIPDVIRIDGQPVNMQ